MHLRNVMRYALVALALALAIPSLVVAQETGPGAADRAAAAAITLTADDLPEGYALTGERFRSPDAASLAGVDPAALAESGLLGVYTSAYASETDGGQIVSYALVWADAAAAETGFATVEADADGGTDAALAAGDGPAEITTGTTEVSGTNRAYADATLVVDRYIVGVAVTAADTTPVDNATVEGLAGAIEDRARAVAAGESPGGTDLALPGAVLDLRPLGDEMQAGYLTASESEELYGVTGSSLGGMRTSWVEAAALGDNDAAPYVAIAATSFETPENAARVVEQAAELVPLTVELEPVDGFTVEGVESVRAFRYAGPAAASDAPDSFRVVAQTGTTVIVIDVQGAPTAEAAEAAATTLLQAQVACGGGGECQAPSLDLGA